MRMPIIFTFVACARLLQKPIGNSDNSPITPDNNRHKHKKTKAFGLVSCRHVPDRVVRFAHNPVLQKDQPPGRLQAVACTEQEVACTVHAIAYTEQAVVCAVHAVAGAMHHEHVPIHRLGIKKCLSQAAQEVKPAASSLSNPWSALRSGVTRG